MKCITIPKIFGKSGMLWEKLTFSHYVPIFSPIPLKIQALPLYEIYVFGMSKTCAIFRQKEIYTFA